MSFGDVRLIGKDTRPSISKREFDPPTSYDGAVAHMGERLFCKQGVVGSSPTGSTRRA